MKKYEKITTKALKVINSCTEIKHLNSLDNYIELAKKQILKIPNSLYKYRAVSILEKVRHERYIFIIKKAMKNFEMQPTLT